jgi:hypothetical protein
VKYGELALVGSSKRQVFISGQNQFVTAADSKFQVGVGVWRRAIVGMRRRASFCMN